MSMYARQYQQKIFADCTKIMLKELNHTFHLLQFPRVHSAKPRIPTIVFQVTGSRLDATKLNTTGMETFSASIFEGSHVHFNPKTLICMK
ncbi:uncharacterized protein J3R85_016015 [Psidium guajava]|nr:uncharacterized protein J3R85_016015 [Psidium guajava]